MSAQKQKASGVFGALAGMVGLSAVAGVLATVMVTPAIAVTGMAASNTIGIFESLPEYIEVGALNQRNTLYAQNTSDPDEGYTAIATVYAQNREEVAWGQVSDSIKKATLAGEDRRFYEHNGVDVQSVVRAALGNLTSGDIESGASTLTMQLVKNICIQEALKIEDTDPDAATAGIKACQVSSLERKLNEAKLAINLEKEFTKDEIMLAYLNIAGFGGNTYGIQAAAQEYFGTTAAEVTLAQAASLIAIVQQPGARSLKSPENYEANQERRDIILGNMLEYGYITKAEYKEAIALPVDETFVTPSTPRSGCIAANDYAKTFCDFVVRNVRNFESLGADAAERAARWKTGGLSVYTTLNLSLQKAAQDTVRANNPQSESYADLGAVATSVEVGTGRVVAMAQNKTFDNTEVGGGPTSTALNLATDRDYGGSIGFQVGSTYKIFALLEWLDEGHGLNELVTSGRFEYPQSTFTDTCNGPHTGTYAFRNFEGSGPSTMTALQATVDSVNSAFIDMASKMDQCAIRDTAMSLGIHRGDGLDLETYPASVLGTNNIAPLSMAAAFAGIANNGQFCSPIIVDRFVLNDGTELPGQKPECDQAVDAEVAHAAAYAMRQVMIRGSGVYSNLGWGTPVIGKTGTTDSGKQTWVVGSTTKVATASWVGNIIGDLNLRRLPGRGDLGQLRHNILHDTTVAAIAQYGGGEFPAPPARLMRGSGFELPDLVGQSPAQAKSILEGLGLRYAEGTAVDSSQPAGAVASTSPGPGALVGRGLTVTVQLSKGTLGVVPDVVSAGYDEAQARAALESVGFSKISVTCVPIDGGDDPEREGIVETQDPAAGTEVKLKTKITIGVASTSCGDGGGGGGILPTPSPGGGG